jgi:beta-galactosidase
MKPITFDNVCFRADGEPFYLCSGEFHYFRVPRRDWRTRMRLLKEAGGNCLATYVPWLIHEPIEGQFRFHSDDGVLNLEEFLQTAAQEGLWVLARPGPYQYSEMKHAGIPGWLAGQYPQLVARKHDGSMIPHQPVSYVHPLLLEKARRWFEQVCPIIARHTVSRGGAVAMAQFDNELMGIQVWRGSMDYNRQAMGFGRDDGLWARWLRQKYGDVPAINEAYGTAYQRLEDVEPVEIAPTSEVPRLRRMRDYFDFYMWTAAQYAATLVGWMRELGIDTPIIHNSGNWNMNSWFQATVERLGEGFLLGSDHYYTLDPRWAQNHPTPQWISQCFHSLEMLRGWGFPPTIFEMPAGSASDWPPITGRDALACYLANVALGMKGHNYYIFTGGPNPPGAGTTTDMYDYGASVGADGQVRPLYHAQKTFGKAMAQHSWLCQAQREFDCRIGMTIEYARAGTYWKERGDFLLTADSAWEHMIRGPIWSSFCDALSPALARLDSDELLADIRTPLIVPCASTMAAADQRRLVRFLEAGGNALLGPVLPTHDDSFAPCTILADFLGSPAMHKSRYDVHRLNIAGVTNVSCNHELFACAGLPAGAEAVGSDEFSGELVAWRMRLAGGGQAVWLGLQWVQAMREHERMLTALLESLGLQRRVACSNPNIWTSLRTAGDRSMLFAMNLLTDDMEATLACRPAWSGEFISLGTRTIPAMTVQMIEVAAETSPRSA